MLGKDLAYALRTLRKSPAFTLTAVVTIGLGIGASTAIFSVMNAVLLRPLPYANADRLAVIWGDLKNRNVNDWPFSAPDYYDLRKDATFFDDIAAVSTSRQPLLSDGGDPEQVRVAGVTPNFLGLMGARIALGRDFDEKDALPQPPAVQPSNAPRLPTIAILSHGIWQRRYGSDPGIVGRNIDLGGGRAQVIGVLAPGFELLFAPSTSVEHLPDIWTAMRIDYQNALRNNVFLRVIGRLKTGVTIERAQVQVNGIASELRRRFPIKETAGLHFRVEPMHEDLVKDVRPTILALMGAVTFLLLIACANVANLVLVRVARRERELAVRSALGGSQWRLVRQMLAESLLLATGGALLGIGLARLGIEVLIALGPEDLPRMDSIAINGGVLAFTALAGLAAAAIFGVVPALRASRPDLIEILRASGRTGGLSAGSLLRKGVVVAEVALSFVLLIGSGLMLRSLAALQRTDPGFDARGILTFTVSGFRGQGPQRATLIQQLRERLRALPGVQSVTAGSPFPLDGEIANGRWGTEEAQANPGKFQQADSHFVLPGYFETLRTPVIAGRTFTDADNVPMRNGIVIDQFLAAKAFPGQSAVGKRLLVRIRSEQPEWLEIIGVVAHQRHASLARPGREAIFFTDAFMGFGAAGRWAVKTSAEPASLGPAVRAEIARLDPRLVVAEVQPMQKFVEHAQAATRFALLLIGVFAGIAVLLAAVGLYGVLSAAVRQRTAEIGVRMALGAAPSIIFQIMVGQGLRLSAAGIALGLLAALVLSRAMVSMLVGVKPTDPLTYATIVALFFLIAAIASWLPAHRAARLDPALALREE